MLLLLLLLLLLLFSTRCLALLHCLQVGATCVLFPNIAKCNPAKVIETMKKYGVTSMGGSPAFIHKVAAYAAEQNMMLPVKCTSLGGAPVFRGPFRTVISVTPDKKTSVIYGATEAEPISYIFAEEKLQVEAEKPDGLCVGRPAFENSVRVIQILKGVSFLMCRECMCRALWTWCLLNILPHAHIHSLTCTHMHACTRTCAHAETV